MSCYYRVNEDHALPDQFQEFEKVAGRLVGAACNAAKMWPHRRHGQPQQGVDYYGRDASGAWIGVQSKLRNGSRRLSRFDVEDEIEKAEGFEPKLSRYFIVTSAPFNARLHKFVESCSRRRVKEGKFSVHIFFRGHVQYLLIKHPMVARQLGYELPSCCQGGVFVLNCG